MPTKTALITGITGQDGSYLAELLLEKGYEVHGIIRRASTFNTDRIDHIYQDPHDEDQRLVLHHGDLADGVMLVNLMRDIQPGRGLPPGCTESRQGLVRDAGVHRRRDGCRHDPTARGDPRLWRGHPLLPGVSSSEMFGSTPPPQNEETPFHPRSPYGCAKVYAYWATVNYREAYGLHATNGILFNHESPRRGETFVTRKITRAVARIAAGIQDALYLGNLDAVRDWGYAKEYVEAQWLMLQQPSGDDYVVATGEAASVRDFCEAVIHPRRAGLGEARADGSRYERPSEVDALIGDASKAQRQLGWKAKTGWRELAELMVDADRQAARGRAGRSARPGRPVTRLHRLDVPRSPTGDGLWLG